MQARPPVLPNVPSWPRLLATTLIPHNLCRVCGSSPGLKRLRRRWREHIDNRQTHRRAHAGDSGGCGPGAEAGVTDHHRGPHWLLTASRICLRHTAMRSQFNPARLGIFGASPMSTSIDGALWKTPSPPWDQVNPGIPPQAEESKLCHCLSMTTRSEHRAQVF